MTKSSNQPITELYEKYKGKEVELCDIKGIVCGYNKQYLIIAITEDRWNQGWNDIQSDDTILIHKYNQLGYYYIPSDILEYNE